MVVRPDNAFLHAKGLLDMLAWELNVELDVVVAGEMQEFAPGRGATVSMGKTVLGRIGQLHPLLVQSHKLGGEAAYLEIDLSPLLEAAKPRQYAGLPKYPSTSRDIALLVDAGVAWRQVREALSEFNVSFVGDYVGDGVPEGKRSLTIRLTITDPDKTPTDAEATELEARVLTRLERKLGAKRRD
jgi:phenylalanyl-tRNA synthetase beta chain